MRTIVLPALIATLGTWGITLIGAATVLFFKEIHSKTMNLLLGFAAGVMIAASFWSLLQPAIEQAQALLKTPAWLIATSGFLCGALFMWLSDKCVHRAFQRLGHSIDSNNKLRRVILLVLSVTLHNIPEGLAIGVAFGALHGQGAPEAWMGAISIAVGIGLQNFPEGAAVSLPLRREGFSRKKSFFIGQLSGIVEPIAGVFGAVSVVYIQKLLPFTLAFAAGSMILVAVHELIPECQRQQQKYPYASTMGIVGGFALMMLLDVALG